ncbi:electron transfer flavoprotein beta subunit [Desulfosalsimonas propionicica]|uniref:Electron transfer flavoprotein subunit beta n=1 Tax=Desulfosalsimonas propionicica TaxID=332175 RepID=A0A7W0C9W9_9BACT|nr:electron transfer flavoprotein beta subunit [Desulfosalsimonas propionicica]
MKILATAKRVTDPDSIIEIKPDGSGIDLSGIQFTINPFDAIAVEEGVRIREAHGGTLTVVSIGSEDCQSEIRKALAMGADRGIFITAPEEPDSDAAARILVKVVEKEQPDIILMGKQAIDLDDNQAAQLLAEYLRWGQACFASRIEFSGNKVVVDREVDDGIEVVEVMLPCVISAELRLNEPRHIPLPAIFKANKKQIEISSISELGIDTAPKVVVQNLEVPAERKSCQILETVSDLLGILKNNGIIA